MIKPNIFLIGVQKAGTTSLYHYLRNQPNIYGPEIKDYNNSHPFFTDEDYYRNNKAEFEKLFSENTKTQHVITSEVELIEDKNYLLKINEYSPDSKIIISLRNPIERLKSMYKFYNQIGRNPENLDFEDALRCNSELYISRSLYSEKVKNAFEVFGKGRIKVVLFEDIVGDRFNVVIDELFKFIDVERIEAPFIHENKTRKLKFKLIARVLKAGRGTKLRWFVVQKVLDPFFNANKRAHLKKKIQEWNLSEHDGSEISIRVPENIRNLILEDVKVLGELLEKDLIKYWSLDQ